MSAATSEISRDEVLAFKASGSWRELARVAADVVADAQLRAGGAMAPKLGGGTRLMLALEHRISDDIDLFIRDPQWIGYMTPRLNDRVEMLVSSYEEGASTLKLKLPKGEIDFIVGMSLLGLPDEADDGLQFPLERVEEVLAKKLFYRGWALAPRDLFDWRAVVEHLGEDHVAGLMGPLLHGDKLAGLRAALHAMQASKSAELVWNAIRAPAKRCLHDCIEWGLKQTAVLERAATPKSVFPAHRGG